MTVVYPNLESKEFESGFASTIQAVDKLVELFDQKTIARREPTTLDDSSVATFEAAVNALNNVLDRTRTLGAYINSFVATDSRNNQAQSKLSEFQQQMLKLQFLSTRFTAWIGSLDIDALVSRSKLRKSTSSWCAARKSKHHIKCRRPKKTWQPNCRSLVRPPGENCMAISRRS
jgi:oligoendopeptidase F